jgi:hypothetical protein
MATLGFFFFDVCPSSTLRHAAYDQLVEKLPKRVRPLRARDFPTVKIEIGWLSSGETVQVRVKV